METFNRINQRTLGSRITIKKRELPRLTLLSGVSLLIAALFIQSLVSFVDGDSESLSHSLLWLMLSFAALFIVAQKPFDLFSPITVLTTAYAALYGLGFGYVSYTLEPRFYWDYDLLNTAMMYAIFGLLALVFGYYATILNRKSPKAFHRIRWSSRRVRIAFFVLLAISLLAYGSLIYQAGGISAYLTNYFQSQLDLFTGWNFYLTLLMPLASAGLFIWYANKLNNRKRDWAFYITALIVLGLSFLQSRTYVLLVFITLIIIRHYLLRPFRLMHVVGLGFIGLSILLGLGIFRESSLRGSEFTDNVNSIEGLTRFLVQHFDFLDTFMLSVRSIPSEVPFQYGATMFLPLLLKPIPRAVIPWKPPGTATFFGEIFFPDSLAAGFNRAASVLTELYINFGFLGILLGMFVIGTLAGLLYRYLRKNPYEVTRVVFYAYTLVTIVLIMRNELQSVLASYLAFVIPLLLIMRYVKGKSNMSKG